MKFLDILFLLGALLLGLQSHAQDVAFSFANPQVTNGGTTYEVDIMISSNGGFKLGSGQLYLNYNEQAFGTNATVNGKVVFSQPTNSILGLALGSPPFQFPFYSSFIANDNTTNRVSFAWQHAFSEACLAANNVAGTPALLTHVTFTFLPGASSIDPQVCFESQDLFVNQTFTACGPGNCTNTNCQSDPGIQLSNDSYDCSALLPVELLSFQVEQQSQDAFLSWATSLEIGSSHFEIEKSIDGQKWQTIGYREAAGQSQTEQKYNYTDAKFQAVSPTTTLFYYRLKMLDLDGSFEYSTIATLQGARTGPYLQIYPNPVASNGSYQVIIGGIARNGNISGTLYDSQGKALHQLVFAVANGEPTSINLDATELKAGVYFIKINTNSQMTLPVQRLLVQ